MGQAARLVFFVSFSPRNVFFFSGGFYFGLKPFFLLSRYCPSDFLFLIEMFVSLQKAVWGTLFHK